MKTRDTIMTKKMLDEHCEESYPANPETKLNENKLRAQQDQNKINWENLIFSSYKSKQPEKEIIMFSQPWHRLPEQTWQYLQFLKPGEKLLTNIIDTLQN